MLKPRAFSIFFYLVVKYILFFTVLAFLGGRYKSMVIGNSTNTRELVSNTLWYSIYPILYTVVGAVIFFAPMYYAFKAKSIAYFILYMSIILVAEYFLYTFLASPSDPINGVYNSALSILLLLIFFYRKISLLSKL
jgi:hypothetical protein